MSYDDLIADVFERGCGVTIDEVTQDPAFQLQRATDLQVYSHYTPNSHRGKLLRYGPHQASEVLQQVIDSGRPKFQAVHIRQQRSRLPEQTLLRALGENIIRAARDCLPPWYGRYEGMWPYFTFEEQHAMLKGFYSQMHNLIALQHERERKERRQTGQSRGQRDKDYASEEVLPKQYGRFWERRKRLNCLGLTQVLIAFAALVDAPVMLVTQLVHPCDVKWQNEGMVCKTLMRHLVRNTIFASSQFVTSLAHSIEKGWEYRAPQHDYHHAIVIKMGTREQGQWVYFDPFVGEFGSLPETVWKIEGIYKRLIGYEPVLPGLTLIGHDHGRLRSLFKELRRKVSIPLLACDEFTEAYWQRFRKMPRDIEEFIDFCLSQETVQAFFTDPKMGGEPAESLRKLFEVLTASWGLQNGSAQELFANDDTFRYRCMSTVRSEFHRIALRAYRANVQSLKDNGLYVPPALEFSLPEVNLALFTLNHVRRWDDRFYHLPAEWMLEHSSSQILWQQCFQRRYRRTKHEQILLDRGEQLVRSLKPHIHFYAREHLREIDRKRGETCRVEAH